jgi:hypothetical protein
MTNEEGDKQFAEVMAKLEHLSKSVPTSGMTVSSVIASGGLMVLGILIALAWVIPAIKSP